MEATLRYSFHLTLTLTTLIAGPAVAKPYCFLMGAIGLPVPVDGVVNETENQLRVTLGAEQRYQSTLLITPPAGTVFHEMSERVELQDAMQLHYLAKLEDAIGSGGPEAGLAGYITDAKSNILGEVACHIQAESSPDPGWCLPLLKTLVVAKLNCNLDGLE